MADDPFQRHVLKVFAFYCLFCEFREFSKCSRLRALTGRHDRALRMR